MAEIFLACPADAALSKLVAIKRILPKLAEDPEFIEMFVREGEIALRFRHPSIIMVHEMGTADDQYYMSMEFFPGKTLSFLINNLRKQALTLDLSDKLYIIKRIAEALQYIHEFSDYGDMKEIIHRDISPQNILVGFDGAVKLIDFGVAKIIEKDEGTKTAVLKGKMSYMSPEQIRGEKLTNQTDIFSLGIVLWELIACKKLFTGQSLEEVATQIEICAVPSLSTYVKGVPKKVEQICRKALAKHLKDRYQSTRDFVDDLELALKALGEEGHQARVSKALQNLVPDELAHLQELLKRHEREWRPTIPANAPKDGIKTSPDSVSAKATPLSSSVQLPLPPPPIPPMPPKVEPSSVSRKERPTPPSSSNWMVNAIVFVIGAVTVLGLTTLLNREHSPLNLKSIVESFEKKEAGSQTEQPQRGITSESEARIIEEPSASAQVPISPRPEPQFRPAAPPALPALNPPVAQKPILPPMPQQPLQPAPVEHVKPFEPPKPVVSLPKHPKETKPSLTHLAAPAPKPKASKPVAAIKETKPAPKQAEPRPVSMDLAPRQPSAIKAMEATKPVVKAPAPQSFAYLTIFADPEAQILVDGKPVGIELVNEIKVPADKKVVIKVVGSSGQGASVQVLQFKPFSRNVLDMASQPAAPAPRKPSGSN